MITSELFNEFLKYLLSGDRASCINIVNKLLADNIDIKVLYKDLFHKAMYEIGDLWENNKITVAVEHLSTAIIESLLTLIYPKLFSYERKRTGKKAIISCIANEYHQIGGKMIADVFELNGWDGYFLGANTPVDGLLSLIDEKKPQIIGLSISVYFNMKNLSQTIDALKSSYPKTEILVGGQAFRWGAINIIKKYSNVNYIESIDKLEIFLNHEHF
jgi:methanogenic corrinoid protein MtbC1